MGQWYVKQCIAIVMNPAHLVKEDARVSSSELLDSWHATAVSGSKALLKKLSVEFTLICKFRMLMQEMTHQIGDLGKLLCAELTVMSQSAFHFNISEHQVNAARTQMFNNVGITITCPRSSGIELRAMTTDDMFPEGLLTLMH